MFQGFAGDMKMAVMRRIKRSAEQADTLTTAA
jgi:hypothetical protein